MTLQKKYDLMAAI